MMRRLVLLLMSPLLLSAAASPMALAEQEAREAVAEQRRLEAAAEQARGAAARAAAAQAAAGQALIAAEARMAASEARLAELGRRRALLEQRLAEERRPATALLGGLAEAGRRPAWLALAAGGAEEQVRLAALVRHVRPEVERRTAGLRAEYGALRSLAERQVALRQELGRQRSAAMEARQRFAALERQALAEVQSRGAQALAAGDLILGSTERLSLAASEAARRRQAAQLASALATLPAAEPRPLPGEGPASSQPLPWSLPASGRVTLGLGELLPNGVRSRGLTIAAASGTSVVAPAAGRVVFAGPFRSRRGVVIVDHGGGWMTLLSDLRPAVAVGEQVGRGTAIGRALGPVSVELFQGGRAEAAALIARSS
jgi:septal ring factor EnvC (AmiA/AmiB activator)